MHILISNFSIRYQIFKYIQKYIYKIINLYFYLKKNTLPKDGIFRNLPLSELQEYKGYSKKHPKINNSFSQKFERCKIYKNANLLE